MMAQRATTTVIWRGRRRTLKGLCRELGVPRQTVQSRLDQGMSLEDALSKPRRPYAPRTRRRAPEPEEGAAGGIEVEPDVALVPILLEACQVLERAPHDQQSMRVRIGIRHWLRKQGWPD